MTTGGSQDNGLKGQLLLPSLDLALSLERARPVGIARRKKTVVQPQRSRSWTLPLWNVSPETHTHIDRHTTPQVSLSLYDMPRPHRRNMAGIFSPGCQKVRVGSGRVRAEAGGRGQWRLAAWCLCACGPCMRTGRKRVGGEVELRRFSLRALLIGPETSWTVARFWCEPSAHQSRRHAQVDRSVQELFLRSGRFWEARQLCSTNSDFGRF